MRYLKRSELKKMVGQELEFEGFHSNKKGVLVFSDNKYWLPFCGLVNAETVRINL